MKLRLFSFLVLAATLVATPLQAEGQLHAFERGSWQAILRAHAGRPTMVNFWGVTCGPCKVELPLLGQLMRETPGLDVVTVSADFVPSLPETTAAVLDKAGLSSAENWIFSDGFVERLRYEIDPSWQGEIPRTVLIASDGKITTIEGIVDIAEVRRWLDQQMAATR
jgi:thiol-disulfide isomerase/thioredoxin